MTTTARNEIKPQGLLAKNEFILLRDIDAILHVQEAKMIEKAKGGKS